jgi:general stress protein YciG
LLTHSPSGAIDIAQVFEETNMGNERRGFASMDCDKQREIASKGGKAAHVKGTAHEWTSEQARDAGRKGGQASAQRSRTPTEPTVTEVPQLASSL